MVSVGFREQIPRRAASGLGRLHRRISRICVSVAQPYISRSRNLKKVVVHNSHLSALNVDFLFVQFFSMVIHLLLSAWLLAAHTGAATLPPTLDLTSSPRAPDKSLADLQAQSNISAVEGNPWWYCTKVDRWILPRWEQHDCQGALDYFWIKTMEEGGSKRIEFRAPGAKKVTHNQYQWTPRKYIFGSLCPCPNSLPTKVTLSCTF